ncbi:MAG: CHAT domain-containing protein [Cyanothece sp. SIO1E1]|nr:CHAT domain-containing protein [Cyanothece sp. SIO1E1]
MSAPASIAPPEPLFTYGLPETIKHPAPQPRKLSSMGKPVIQDKIQMHELLATQPHHRQLSTWMPPQFWVNPFSLAAVLMPLAIWLTPTTAAAQPIISDGTTGTVITVEGDRFDISGGQFSADGTNLFQSFSQFGLNSNQIANFLSSPSIQNILGRVTGGNASVIDGLIQVSGGNSNLFLINPAGIMFGSNAQLNLPAAFSATTATSIGFENGWLEVLGTNDYANLMGNPNAFQFDLTQPGAVVNAANLAVKTGEDLSLTGGTVISTGSLAAPAGSLTVVSVPGTSRLQITPTGSLLSLEIDPPTNRNGNLLPITPVLLPNLLTGGNTAGVTGIAVTPSGQMQLTQGGISPDVNIEPGDVVVKQATAANITLSAQRDLTLVESPLLATSQLDLLAQETVFIRDSETNPVTIQAGGDLLVQGNQGIDILALNHPETPFVSGGNLTLVSDGIISGDAQFASGGSFSIQTLAGNPGSFVSFFDPIISSVGDVVFGDYTGASLKVESQGSITGGDINITAPDTGLTGTDPDIAILTGSPSLILRAGLTTLVNAPNVPQDAGETSFSTSGGPTSPGNVSVGNITTNAASLETPAAGPVIISATGNITTADIDTSVFSGESFSELEMGGAVDLRAGGDINTGAIDTSANVSFSSSNAQGGSVSLNAGGNITFESINTQGISEIIEGPVPEIEEPFPEMGEEEEFLEGDGFGGDVSLIASGTVIGNGEVLIDGEVPSGSGSTISTLGIGGSGSLPGSVTIQHNGGPDNVSFIVGGGSVAENGTAFAIDAGNDNPLLSGEFPVLPNGGSVNPRSNITITSVNTPPALIPNTVTIDIESNASITLQLADLFTVSDADLDNTFVQIDQILVGTLTQADGTILSSGDVVSLSEALTYTPPDNTTELTNAFTLQASDRAALSEPVQVAVNPLPEPPTEVPPPEPPTEEPPPEPPMEVPLPELPPEEPLPIPPDSRCPPFCDNDTSGITRRAPGGLIALPLPQDTQTELATIDEAYTVLRKIEEATGIKPALIYVSFIPAGFINQADFTLKEAISTRQLEEHIEQTEPRVDLAPQDEDQLELLLVTSGGQTIRKLMRGVTRSQVLEIANQFRTQVTRPGRTGSKRYLTLAQQLHEWLIAPLEADLQTREINNLAFIMDQGLRSLPIAALHDGQSFLVEQYSVGLMPSLSLTDTRYVDVRKAKVLAMGTSLFPADPTLEELPAVPTEVSNIADNLWSGKAFLGEDFTLSNLRAQRRKQPYGIVHLATHGEFRPGKPDNSFIQLWDQKLQLDQLRQLGWNDPPVELVVLSACRTALGDIDAELGFAGFAVQAGVKSALASLWYISDAGTLGFMTEFYRQLRVAPVKSEAVRQAQVALLSGQVKLENGQLINSVGEVMDLPFDTTSLGTTDLSHPFFWSAFTVVGNPW